jgi:hypothetical protein
MNKQRPFVQIYYDLKDHWIFQPETNPAYAKAFMLMVLRANHTTSHRLIAGKMYEIKPGELFFNATTFGQESGLGSKSTVSRFITLLQKEGLVEKLHKYKEPTRLKITNFVQYGGNKGATKMKQKWEHYNNENNEITYIYKCSNECSTITDINPNLYSICKTCSSELKRVGVSKT